MLCIPPGTRATAEQSCSRGGARVKAALTRVSVVSLVSADALALRGGGGVAKRREVATSFTASPPAVQSIGVIVVGLATVLGAAVARRRRVLRARVRFIPWALVRSQLFVQAALAPRPVMHELAIGVVALPIGMRRAPAIRVHAIAFPRAARLARARNALHDKLVSGILHTALRASPCRRPRGAGNASVHVAGDTRERILGTTMP